MKKTKVNGSALVFSLVMMFIILTAALGVASVSVVEKRNSSATGRATQSFQVADSAVEMVLKRAVLDPEGTTLNGLEGGVCTDGAGVAAVVEFPVLDSSVARVSFLDLDGGPVTDCTTNLSQVSEVKAVGSYRDSDRAISAAVAAGTLRWTEVTTYHSPYRAYSGNEVYCAKDLRTGLVYLKGMVNTASGGTSGGDKDVLTLPESCWPPSWKMFGVVAWSPSAAVAIRMDVESNGKIDFSSGITQVDIISFNGVSFSTN